jgi:hypothetical protein
VDLASLWTVTDMDIVNIYFDAPLGMPRVLLKSCQRPVDHLTSWSDKTKRIGLRYGIFT